MRTQAGRIAFTLIVGFAFVVVNFTVSIAAQETVAPDTEPQAFSISPQPLSEALLKFAAQSGVEVQSDDRMTQDKTSPGAQGRYTAEDALKALLEGSGLDYRFTDTNAVTLVQASRQDVLPSSTAAAKTPHRRSRLPYGHPQIPRFP